MDVESVQGFEYIYDIHMRITSSFYVDALESLCIRFGWKQLSVVISDEDELAFASLRQELARRAQNVNATIRIAIIREFSSDATILANHEGTNHFFCPAALF